MVGKWKARLKNMRLDVALDMKNEVVVKIKSKYADFFFIFLGGKTYKFKDGIVVFKKKQIDVLKRIANGDFSIGILLMGKRISWNVEKKRVVFHNVQKAQLKRLINLENKVYCPGSNAILYFTQIKENEQEYIVDYYIYAPFFQINPGSVFVYKNDKNKTVLQKIPLEREQGTIRIKKLENNIREARMIFTYQNEVHKYAMIQRNLAIEDEIGVWDKTFFFEKGFCLISSDQARHKLKYNGYSQKIEPLAASQYFKKISFEKRTEQLQFFSKEGKVYQELVLYLKNLRDNTVAEISRSAYEKTQIVANWKKVMELPLNCVEKYIFEYVLLDKNNHILEKQLVKVQLPRFRRMEQYILAEHHGNVLSFVEGYLLTLTKKTYNNFIPERLGFYFPESTIQAYCDQLEMDNEGLSFHLNLESFLSRMKKYSIFVSDNYTKEEYVLVRKEQISVKRISEKIQLPYSDLEPYVYYNARLNFRVAVEFFNGHTETVQIAGIKDSYTAETRMRLHYKKGDVIWNLYLGENRYLLNLWYTSEEEYQKGTSFQIAKTRFAETMETEELDEQLILFEAFLGKNYAGNPKYLYEEMLRSPRYQNFKFVWSYAGPKPEQIKGNPVIVERGTETYFYYLAKAKYWVNNILFPVKEKRVDTVYLQTWHGTPLKKLGFDIEVDGPEKQGFNNLYAESQNWDYLLVDNDYGEEKLVGAFRFKKQVLKMGYPINDIFYNKAKIAECGDKFNQAYPINGRKVILYAPTWRDLDGDYVRGFEFNLPFELERMYAALHEDYIVLVKVHHLISDSLVIPSQFQDFIVNVSDIEDIQELLVIADILITDYSSVFYDYANARRPILFYMYDMERYITKTRGLYIDVADVPGPIAKDTDELIAQIESVKDGTFAYERQLEEFCNEMTRYSDGTASKKILERVIGENLDD